MLKVQLDCASCGHAVLISKWTTPTSVLLHCPCNAAGCHVAQHAGGFSHQWTSQFEGGCADKLLAIVSACSHSTGSQHAVAEQQQLACAMPAKAGAGLHLQECVDVLGEGSADGGLALQVTRHCGGVPIYGI